MYGLCGLQVKLLEWNSGKSIKLADFFAKAVEPPAAPSVENAIQLLGNIGALEPRTERLTLLGQNLARLPLPPTLGKMLLYSILFGTLDPLLTIACCISYRYRVALVRHPHTVQDKVGQSVMYFTCFGSFHTTQGRSSRDGNKPIRQKIALVCSSRRCRSCCSKPILGTSLVHQFE